MGVTATEHGAAQAVGPKPKRMRRGFSVRDRRDFPIFLLLALPNILLIMAFIYRPLITNMYYSTLNWTLGSKYAKSIGLGNYEEFFTDHE